MNKTASSARRPPTVFWVLLAAAGTMALTMGVRQSFGLFLNLINTHTGLGLASISLAFAFGQLWWGLTQPLAGLVADRIGAGRVLALGVLLVAIGTALVPWMHTTAGLVLAIGVLSAGGAGLAGPAVLMAATNRLIPPSARGMASGIVNAGGSFGQFVFVPIAQGLSALAGWMVALQGMALLMLAALPAAWLLRGAPPPAAPASTGARPSTRPVRDALAHPGYQLLTAGFFVCGFHVAFIATHLPGVVAACGLPPSIGAWSLAVIGLFNIVGSLAMGWAVGRWRMRSLLALVYAVRAVAVVVFLLSPKSALVMLVFAAVMGVTYLSTVPPTVGLVAKFFGPTHLATLFGLVMLSHQVGGFLGAWLGGQVFEATGSYDGLWWLDAGLAVAAALLHLPIREAAPRLAPVAVPA